MTDQPDLNAADPEPAMVAIELHFMAAGRRVWRSEQGHVSKAQKYMLARGWLERAGEYYLAITEAGIAEHLRRQAELTK